MTLAELIDLAKMVKSGQATHGAFQFERERYIVDHIERKHLGWFVKGAIADYFQHGDRGKEELNSSHFQGYYNESLERVYSYLKYGRTAGNWSDAQCAISHEAMKVFLPGLYY